MNITGKDATDQHIQNRLPWHDIGKVSAAYVGYHNGRFTGFTGPHADHPRTKGLRFDLFQIAEQPRKRECGIIMCIQGSSEAMVPLVGGNLAT